MRREGIETEIDSAGERMDGVGRMPSGEEERKVADAGVGRIQQRSVKVRNQGPVKIHV